VRRYENVFIAHADLSDDDIGEKIKRYGAIITDGKGIIVRIEKWGKKKLAYEIKKQSRGYYILIDFAAPSATVSELERNLRIDEKILKFMTVMKEDHVDMQQLEQEIAASKEIPTAAPPPPTATPDGTTVTEAEQVKTDVQAEEEKK
jgi:small subunit ribosomal protein S6